MYYVKCLHSRLLRNFIVSFQQASVSAHFQLGVKELFVALQHTATHRNALTSELRAVAVCCGVLVSNFFFVALQHSCNTQQHTVTHRNALTSALRAVAVCCGVLVSKNSVLRCNTTATHCNSPQHTATH